MSCFTLLNSPSMPLAVAGQEIAETQYHGFPRVLLAAPCVLGSGMWALVGQMAKRATHVPDCCKVQEPAWTAPRFRHVDSSISR